MHPDPGRAPDRRQFVQARPGRPPHSHAGARRRGALPRQGGGRCRRVPRCRRSGSAGSRSHWTGRPPRPRARFPPRAAPRPAGGGRAALGHAGDVVADRALGSKDGDVLAQPPRHRVAVSRHAQVASGLQRAVNRSEIPVQVSGGVGGSADPRLTVLADHQGGDALGERAVDPPACQQRSFRVGVRIDEARADDAARGQVDHLGAWRGVAGGTDEAIAGPSIRTSARRSWRRFRRRPGRREAASVWTVAGLPFRAPAGPARQPESTWSRHKWRRRNVLWATAHGREERPMAEQGWLAISSSTGARIYRPRWPTACSARSARPRMRCSRPGCVWAVATPTRSSTCAPG